MFERRTDGPIDGPIEGREGTLKAPGDLPWGMGMGMMVREDDEDPAKSPAVVVLWLIVPWGCCPKTTTEK